MQVYIAYFFYSLCALFAFGILFTKDIFRAALYLLGVLLCIASLYVFMAAEFVAVTQILVYAGGVVIILIFGIMITQRISGAKYIIKSSNIFPAIVLGAALIASIIFFMRDAFDARHSPDTNEPNRVSQTGMELLTSYLIPFELAGIILLIALIAAAAISSGIKNNPR